MPEPTIIILVGLYLVVGLFVALVLYVTREGYESLLSKITEGDSIWIIFAPDLCVLAFALWPLFLLARIYRLVRNWNSSI